MVQASLIEAVFLDEVFPSQVTLDCVKLTIKTDQDRGISSEIQAVKEYGQQHVMLADYNFYIILTLGHRVFRFQSETMFLPNKLYSELENPSGLDLM